MRDRILTHSRDRSRCAVSIATVSSSSATARTWCDFVSLMRIELAVLGDRLADRDRLLLKVWRGRRRLWPCRRRRQSGCRRCHRTRGWGFTGREFLVSPRRRCDHRVLGAAGVSVVAGVFGSPLGSDPLKSLLFNDEISLGDNVPSPSVSPRSIIIRRSVDETRSFL